MIHDNIDAFTIVANGASAQFEVTSSNLDRCPLIQFKREEGLSAVLFGRLYYLNHCNGYSNSATASSSEYSQRSLHTALRTYREFGLSGLEQLEGDFAFVVLDERFRRLVAVRDPLGGYPIFWTKVGTTVAISSSIRQLLRLQPNKTLNRSYLAAYIMSLGPVFEEMPGTDCVYEGINRLPAGASLIVDLDAGQITTKIHWDWMDEPVDIKTDKIENLSEEYCDLLRSAVSERMVGQTMCHLSGGVDSSTVTLLAHQSAVDRKSCWPVHTVSLVYRKFSQLAEERRYIDQVLGACPSLSAHFVDADDLVAFGEPFPHDEPWPGLFWSQTEASMLSVARGHGMSTVLTGAGADEQVFADPSHLANDLRSGRLVRMWKEAGLWANEFACNRWSILKESAITPNLPAVVRDGIMPLLRGGYASWARQGITTIPPWVKPDFAVEQRMYLRGRNTARRIYDRRMPLQLSLAKFGLDCRIGDLGRWSLAAPCGIHQAHPFLDPRAVRFALGVLREVRSGMGRLKPLVTHAMSGLLPEAIIDRAYPASFNEYYFTAWANNGDVLRELTYDPYLRSLDLFDMGEIARCLEMAILGIAKDSRVLGRLDLTFSLLIWLSQEFELQSCKREPLASFRVDLCSWKPAPS
jgi:asparagine synthase (glutamine-hydrolysing)